MARHDINEGAPAINKDLEQHYKEVIALKNAQLEEAKDLLNEFNHKIEQLTFVIKMQKKEIETLRKALIDTMIEKTEAKHAGK